MEQAENDAVAKLLSDLRSLVTLLNRAGYGHWAEWLRRAVDRIEARDPYGVRYLLEAFGGMGSINDLQIDSIDGHEVTEELGRRLTDVLRYGLSRVWTVAKALARELGVD